MANKFINTLNSLVFKCFFILYIGLLATSCNNNSKGTKTKSTNLELSKESIVQFNRIFKDYYLNGMEYQFNSGHLIENPKLNKKYINPSDTNNLVFFVLESDNIDNLTITVNKEGCFASVVYNLEGYLYPNHSVIFPNDYSFLNKDQLAVKFDCINKDSLDQREIDYDANMIGTWYVDSISSIRKNYTQSFDIKSITIDKEQVVLNDSIDFEYYHSGYKFQLKGSKYDFYKVHINKDYMIMINTYKNSYEEFYFIKKNLPTPNSKSY